MPTAPVTVFPDPILSSLLVSPSRLTDTATPAKAPRFGVYLSPSGNPGIVPLIVRHEYKRIVERYLRPACDLGAEFTYVWYPHRLSPEPLVWFEDPLHCSQPYDFVDAMHTLPVGIDVGAYLRRPYSVREPWTDARGDTILKFYAGLTLFFDAIFGDFDPASRWPMFQQWFDAKTPNAGGEPLWNASPDTWGWDRPCIVTEQYYQWQKARGWDLSREPVAGLPEVIRTDYGVPIPSTSGMTFPQAREAIRSVLAGFYQSCVQDGHSCIVGADLLVDYRISRADLSG